ncbi:MAG: 30S ribosomal protein S17 [Silvanigrellaceae bacterium]
MTTTDNVTKNPVRARVVGLSKDGRTAKVEVPRVVVDERYGKRLQRQISLHVDAGEAKVVVGKEVMILPCRRISKTKSWKVVSVI